MYLADRTAFLMCGQNPPSFMEYYSTMTKGYTPVKYKEKPQIYKTLEIIKQVEEWNKHESI